MKILHSDKNFGEKKERDNTLAEGAGAVSLAGLLKQKEKWHLGKKCALIISGGNVDLNILSHVIKKGLRKAGRLGQISIRRPSGPLRPESMVMGEELGQKIGLFP